MEASSHLTRKLTDERARVERALVLLRAVFVTILAAVTVLGAAAPLSWSAETLWALGLFLGTIATSVGVYALVRVRPAAAQAAGLASAFVDAFVASAFLAVARLYPGSWRGAVLAPAARGWLLAVI